MARRSGTLGLSEIPQDIVADVLGEETAAEGSVGATNVSSGAGDGAVTTSPVTVSNASDAENITVTFDSTSPQNLPVGSKEVYRIDFMTPSGMLRLAKILLPNGEEIWRFSIWDNPVTAKMAAQILKDNGLVPMVPKEALPYLPDLLEE